MLVTFGGAPKNSRFNTISLAPPPQSTLQLHHGRCVICLHDADDLFPVILELVH